MRFFLVLIFVMLNFCYCICAQGVGMIKLPDPDKQGSVTLEKALNERRSLRQYKQEKLSLSEISQILWAAHGTNAFGKVTVPSAGARYPLRLYLIVGNVAGINQGIYRYNNKENVLELLEEGDKRIELSSACLGQKAIASAPAVIVICADYSITTSRYKERGRRYVEIEVGHTGQNICLQAVALGLGTVPIGAFSDQVVKDVLGVREEPIYILPIGKAE